MKPKNPRVRVEKSIHHQNSERAERPVNVV
jgi:hypothetical protein